MICLLSLFRKKKAAQAADDTMRHLIVGLGNPGDEYAGTRHNVGFMVVDALAESLGLSWQDKRYGWVAKGRVKNAELVLLKPSTYMNLSGNAVRYWMDKENVPIERTLIVCDDLSLPFGKIRLRPAGSDGGHNGLKDIAQKVGGAFPRLRMGIGNDFPRGGQIAYVLSTPTDEEQALLPERLSTAGEAVKAFALSGITFAMNHFNSR